MLTSVTQQGQTHDLGLLPELSSHDLSEMQQRLLGSQHQLEQSSGEGGKKGGGAGADHCLVLFLTVVKKKEKHT